MRILVDRTEERDTYLESNVGLVTATTAIVGGALLFAGKAIDREIPFVTASGLREVDDNRLVVVMQDIPTEEVAQRNVAEKDAPREGYIDQEIIRVDDVHNAKEVIDAIDPVITSLVEKYGTDTFIDVFPVDPDQVTVLGIDVANELLPSTSGAFSGLSESYSLQVMTGGENAYSEESALKKEYESRHADNHDLPLPKFQNDASFPMRYTAEQYAGMLDIAEAYGFPGSVTLTAALQEVETPDSALQDALRQAIVTSPHSELLSDAVIIQVWNKDGGRGASQENSAVPIVENDGSFQPEAGFPLTNYCEVNSELHSLAYVGLENATYTEPVFGALASALAVVAIATRIKSMRRNVNGVEVPEKHIRESVEQNTATTAQKLEMLRYRQALAIADTRKSADKDKKPHALAKFARFTYGAVISSFVFIAGSYTESKIDEKPSTFTYDTTNLMNTCDPKSVVFLKDITTDDKLVAQDVHVMQEDVDSINDAISNGSITVPK